MNNDDKEKLREVAAGLAKLMPQIISQVRDYAALNYRTPEEEKQYQELLKLVKESLPVITLLKDFFGSEAYRSTVGWYYSVKEAAEQGNSKAREIVDELAPLYQQSIIDQLNKN